MDYIEKRRKVCHEILGTTEKICKSHDLKIPEILGVCSTVFLSILIACVDDEKLLMQEIDNLKNEMNNHFDEMKERAKELDKKLKEKDGSK